MLRKYYGDIFDSGAHLIIHQVNCQGVMKSGIAKQVKERYPHVYDEYHKMCLGAKKSSDLLGTVLGVFTSEKKDQLIVNIFSQDNYGYDGKQYTNYEAMKTCFDKINKNFKGLSVAIPYKIGCVRGGGDWEVVKGIIEETLTDCEVSLYEL